MLLIRLAPVLLLGAGLFFGGCSSDPKIEINSFSPEVILADDNSAVFVNGIPSLWLTNEEQMRQLFSVFVIEEEDIWQKSNTPISGSYSYKEDQLIFTPRYPFLENTRYYARFNISPFVDLEESDIEWVSGYSFNISNDKPPVTYVEQVYPTINQIPRNLLKFYVQFSGSMTEGHMLENIRILDENGKIVEYAFLEIPQELWDVNRQRLTILFDPGRIKRGMELLNEVGAPFEIGKQYTLKIDQGWKDGRQRELTKGFEKKFTVIQDDRTKLDERLWEIISPQKETKNALEIRFGESLDYALLQRSISVWDNQKEQIVGNIELDENESVWKFIPDKVWEKGSYSIKIETFLEDLAGNNLISVFDVDLENEGEVVNRKEAKEFIKLLFKLE